MLEQKAKMPDAITLQKDIETAEAWESAYWIGRFVFEQASGEADKLIMYAYEKAFNLGLNVRSNREKFLIATQQIAKIYFQFRKYDEAINKLMVLDSNVDDLPDWVNLYYASAQIHTENILYWAECPAFLFRRIDHIDEANTESVNKRKYLFLEFLNRISELANTTDVSGVDKNAILSKAADLGVENSRECNNFKVALGILPVSSENAGKPALQEINGERITSVYEQMVVELNKRLAELQAIIDRQALSIERQATKEKNQQKEIEVLRADKDAIKKKFERQADELRTAKEEANSWQAKCKALETQLSGSEATRKQLEDNAIAVGELQTDVEDLKIAVTVSREKNQKLRAEIEEKQAAIDKLEETLHHNEDEIQNLHATVKSQKLQLEIAEAAVKAAEEKALAHRPETIDTGDRATEADSPQTAYHDVFSVNSFLQRRQKILIIGGSEAKETHLRGKLKKMGFDFSKEQLEFELEYDDVKSYASRIKPWNSKYAGIIVGPCPHKAKDTEGYSSFIEKLKSEEGYPHIEEARDKSNTLKISNDSIGEAMLRMAVYLHSIA